MNLGELVDPKYISNSLKFKLKFIAELHPVRKWWLADCKELELELDAGKFKTNDLNCYEKRMPICEIWR